MPSLCENPDEKQALMRIRLDSRGHAVKRTILGFKDAYDSTIKGKKQNMDDEAHKGELMRAKLASKFRSINMKSPVKFTSLNSPTLQ